jgi:hypothetical protein
LAETEKPQATAQKVSIKKRFIAIASVFSKNWFVSLTLLRCRHL